MTRRQRPQLATLSLVARPSSQASTAGGSRGSVSVRHGQRTGVNSVRQLLGVGRRRPASRRVGLVSRRPTSRKGRGGSPDSARSFRRSSTGIRRILGDDASLVQMIFRLLDGLVGRSSEFVPGRASSRSRRDDLVRRGRASRSLRIRRWRSENVFYWGGRRRSGQLGGRGLLNELRLLLLAVVLQQSGRWNEDGRRESARRTGVRRIRKSVLVLLRREYYRWMLFDVFVVAIPPDQA